VDPVSFGLPALGDLLFLAPLALAAGLDLFLVLLVLGVAGLLGLGGEAPPALAYLGDPITILGAALLHLVERWHDAGPRRALLWHSVQLLVRPLGGGLLALLLTHGLVAGGMQLAVVLLGSVLALLAHHLRWGIQLLQDLLRLHTPRRWLLLLGWDASALGLALLALDAPRVGVLVVAAVTAALLLAPPGLLRVPWAGPFLARDLVWALVSPLRWRTGSDLPRWVGREGDVGPGEVTPPCGIRAWAYCPRGGGLFRGGWLVTSGSGTAFRYRRRGGPVSLPVASLRETDVVRTPIAMALRPTGTASPYAVLFLQRHAPPLPGMYGEENV